MKEDKKLVAYCGLYCGDCVNYQGEIADLARDLRKKLRQEKFDRVSKGLTKYFKEFKDYEQCYTVLGAMVVPQSNIANMPNIVFKFSRERSIFKLPFLQTFKVINYLSWNKHVYST